PPVDGVVVPVRDVDRQPGRGEVLPDVRVAEGVQAHPDLRRAARLDGRAEDLHDADLGAALGPVLETDEPARGHRTRVQVGAGPHLDAPEVWRAAPEGGLLLPDREAVPVGLLAHGAADRAGEAAGL